MIATKNIHPIARTATPTKNSRDENSQQQLTTTLTTTDRQEPTTA